MALIDGTIGYRILRKIAPAEPAHMSGNSYRGLSKVEVLLSKTVWSEIKDKVVIDFGCGAGAEAIEIARHGAAQVYGIDIVDRLLVEAREEAAQAQCQNVRFGRTPQEPADVIISIDAFEHFADAAAVLDVMAGMLRPTGCVLASFGPTWYHPLGGHLFSIFPWAHLVFGEEALCKWRSHIRQDGAQKFSEVEGGLNQMTIRRFRRLVESSPLKFASFEPVPIRVARHLHNRFTQEFFTAVVRCKLIPRRDGGCRNQPL
jgi:SAM-dependent methyltransferase